MAEQEPTMEEILASIRRIISEEDETPAEEAIPEEAISEETISEEAIPEETIPEDVIYEEPVAEILQDEPELSTAEGYVDDSYKGEEIEPSQEVYEDDPVTENVLKEDYVDEVVDSPVVEQPSPAAINKNVAWEAPETEEGLLSSDAAGAASAAFGDLNRTLTVPSGEGKTVEAIVSELLRPMLKDWLDQNLPPLVEEMVQEEIERLARRRRPS